jgi:hypothetical protein
VGQETHGAENNNLGMLQHSSPQGMGNFVNSFEGRLQVSLSLSVISSVFDPISSHIPVKIKEKIWKGEFIDLNLYHCLQRVLFEVDFLHNKRSWSDAHFKSFSFASVATATQIILATLPLYSQNVLLSKLESKTSKLFHNEKFKHGKARIRVHSP